MYLLQRTTIKNNHKNMQNNLSLIYKIIMLKITINKINKCS